MTTPTSDTKIVLTGGAGLVGQNLVIKLLERGYGQLTIIDKHAANLDIMRGLHPGLDCIEEDLAEAGRWQEQVSGADVVVMLQAQIGALTEDAFTRNNITATDKVIETMEKAAEPPYLVHVSSSVVLSVADDFYTRSKKAQEQAVAASALKHCVLRPTLMFGWFDRKHLGWLSRFMQRTPIFPIPGDGNYLRQPLYAGDFCNIVLSCLQNQPDCKTYNITGLEQISFIDMIRSIKMALRSRCLLLPLPYGLFYGLLKTYSFIDRNPPFTTDQLKALVADDIFEVIDWEGEFDVRKTPLQKAILETYTHPAYSNNKIALKF